MVAILFLAMLVMLWAWREQGLKALRFGDIAAAIAGFAGAIATIEGKSYGVLVLVLAGAWFWQSRRRGPAIDMPAAEARAVLGLPAGADASTIRSAHRRLIARTHPDQGGPTDLAARINAARDVLLAELNEPAIPAS